MHIFVEHSGHGRYGLCTLLPADQLGEVLKKTSEYWGKVKRENERAWGQPHDLDMLGGIGIGESLWLTKNYNQHYKEGIVRLTWQPTSVHLALLTHGLINQLFGGYSSEDSVAEDELALFVNQTDSGWHVQADFGPKIWDVIEHPDFGEKVLPGVNYDMQMWWEDRTNRRAKHEMITVFKGRTGQVLQVYHDEGNGLWIAGSRQPDFAHQLCDHNTDAAYQAHAHVIAMMLVHKACREVLAK